MIYKVRLQRKFTLKGKIDFIAELAKITRLMIIFELMLIIISCLLNLSLHFHINHIFTCEFWTNQSVANTNLALAICCFLIIPHLIFYEEINKVAEIRDLIGTAIFLHTFVSFFVNSFTISVFYVIFVTVVGGISMALGSYAAVMKQQKKLIEQIRKIQEQDRQQHLKEEQPQKQGLKFSQHH